MGLRYLSVRVTGQIFENLRHHLQGTAVSRLLIVFLAVLLLLPLWRVRFPPLLDYPDHLARAFIIFHLNDSHFQFREFYSSEWGPYPYLGMDLALIGLQHLLPIETAGRLLLSMCVILVPVACWWFLRHANPGNDALALWALLQSYNLFLLAGFVNFQLGLAFCFLALGFWLRYLKNPTSLCSAIVLTLLTCTYFLHLLAFAIAGFIVLVYSLAARVEIRRVVWSWSLFAPALILFLKSNITSYNGQAILFRTAGEKWSQARATLLYSYSIPFEIASFWIIVACLFIAWFRNREFKLNPTWSVVFCALFVLYLVLPNGIGNAWSVDLRILPALFVVLLGTAKLGRRQSALAVVAIFIFAVHSAFIMNNFVSQQFALSKMQKAIERLSTNARVFPIINVDLQRDDMPHQLYAHFWAYAVIQQGARVPYLFDLPGQTPLRTSEQVYMPDNPDETAPDWKRVSKNYDYVWAYDCDYYGDTLRTIGTGIYHAGRLQVFRLR